MKSFISLHAIIGGGEGLSSFEFVPTQLLSGQVFRSTGSFSTTEAVSCMDITKPVEMYRASEIIG